VLLSFVLVATAMAAAYLMSGQSKFGTADYLIMGGFATIMGAIGIVWEQNRSKRP